MKRGINQNSISRLLLSLCMLMLMISALMLFVGINGPSPAPAGMTSQQQPLHESAEGQETSCGIEPAPEHDEPDEDPSPQTQTENYLPPIASEDNAVPAVPSSASNNPTPSAPPIELPDTQEEDEPPPESTHDPEVSPQPYTPGSNEIGNFFFN